MKHVHALEVSPDLRAAVVRLADRLAPVRVVATTDWQRLVDQCGVVSSDNSENACLVVGSPAFVLKHAAATAQVFGFVMPVALRRKPWQRSMAWRDDGTLELWKAGWSPQAVDRILVPTNNVVIEFVTGDVRRIPLVVGMPEGQSQPAD